jgi:hypothetical protein
MTVVLKQSTQIKVRIGPFVDVTDGATPETGVTLGAADQAEALKANGAATVDISAATWAAVTGADGWYDLTLTTSHTDTVGELIIVVQDSSVCLPVFQRFQVIEEALYDGLYAASAAVIPANVTQWLGTAAATPSVAGVPEVDITHVLGTAAVSTGTAGTLDVNTAQINGVSNAAQVLRRWLGALGHLTADSGTTTTITDTALTGAAGSYIGWWVYITAGTNSQQARRVVAFDATTDTATVWPAFTSAIDNTSTYIIVPDSPASDVWGWLNTQAATPTVAGVPEVDLTHISGSAVSATTAQLGVNVVNLNNNLLSVQRLQAFWSACPSGTSDSGTTTTMVDAARTESDSDYFKGSWIHFTSGTISGQTRRITAFDPATDTITFSPATTQAVSTQTYQIVPAAYVDVAAWLGVTVTGDGDWAELQTDVDDILVDTSTTLQGELDGIQADTEDIQSRLPAALISGRIDATVGAMQANVMTAAAAAADLTTELQSGLATAADLATVDTVVDAIKAKTDNLPTDPADQSILEGKIDTIDTVADAIKAKTDSLTFTVAGQVDSNIQYVNDVEVTGNGEAGTEWGPA